MKTRKIAIMIRVTLELESLNNEGSIGNILLPRQAILSDGSTRQAIAGEMLNHMHTKNTRLLADDSELCDGCKIFSPMKNSKIKAEDKSLSSVGNRVKQCIVDDIHGFMLPDKSDKRDTCIHFSWAAATEENEYQNTTHTRVDRNIDKKSKKKNDDNTDNSEEKSGQMIFKRPLRSNEYALVVSIDLDRIGKDENSIVERYVLPEDQLILRQKKCMKALVNMFIDMEGALCATRMPHLRNIEGIVVDKQDKNDVLIKYSPLNDDYREVVQRMATKSIIFNNVEEFAKVMSEIV